MVDNSEMLDQLRDGYRAIIESKLQGDEEILAVADATIPPPGAAAGWVPFVGKFVDLARGVATKVYTLVVTNERFWLIGINKWSKKEVKETSFEALPITDIKTAVTDKKSIHEIYEEDSLKLSTFSGRKLKFRGLQKEDADLIRDSIIHAQEAAQT